MSRRLGSVVPVVLLGVVFLAEQGRGEPPSLYVNRQYGFQLTVPSHWFVYERSAEELAALLAAAHHAAGVSPRDLDTGLVALFSELPLGSATAFNTNMIASSHELNPEKALPEELLRQAALRMLGRLANQGAVDVIQERDASAKWIWAEYRYEQASQTGRVPIKVRLAVAIHPRQPRYVLITATCLEDGCAQYAPLFRASLMSFQWTGEGN